MWAATRVRGWVKTSCGNWRCLNSSPDAKCLDSSLHKGHPGFPYSLPALFHSCASDTLSLRPLPHDFWSLHRATPRFHRRGWVAPGEGLIREQNYKSQPCSACHLCPSVWLSVTLYRAWCIKASLPAPMASWKIHPHLTCLCTHSYTCKPLFPLSAVAGGHGEEHNEKRGFIVGVKGTLLSLFTVCLICSAVALHPSENCILWQHNRNNHMLLNVSVLQAHVSACDIPSSFL